MEAPGSIIPFALGTGQISEIAPGSASNQRTVNQQTQITDLFPSPAPDEAGNDIHVQIGDRSDIRAFFAFSRVCRSCSNQSTRRRGALSPRPELLTCPQRSAPRLPPNALDPLETWKTHEYTRRIPSSHPSSHWRQLKYRGLLGGDATDRSTAGPNS
jgi:hypothetical protein